MLKQDFFSWLSAFTEIHYLLSVDYLTVRVTINNYFPNGAKSDAPEIDYPALMENEFRYGEDAVAV